MSRDENELQGIIDPEELIEESYDDEVFNADDLEDEGDQSFEDGVEAALESIEFKNYKNNSVLENVEVTRSRLAIIYTLLTFLIFIIGIIVAVVDGLHRNVSIVDNLKEIIPLLSGVFLGTLGFVLGYYFRKENE